MSISARDNGTIEAMYVLLRDDKAARTKEIIEDILLADYNKRNELVGIEVLAPVKITEIMRLVDKPRRGPFRRFIKAQAPDELVPRFSENFG